MPATENDLKQEALELIDREIERAKDARLPGISDHLRGLAAHIRDDRLIVARIDEDGMTFLPTEEGRKAGLDQLDPTPGATRRGQKLIIEEQAQPK
ncbi:MAG: hypothetical protein HQ478_10215 [Chloroflexi bacterium]|nr:hypothetical protein [Chloroflexota bacterium]